MRALQRISVALCAVLFGLLLVGIVAPGEASAHERRDLAGGKYRAVVGFLTEPAYEGEPNGLDLTVTSLTEKTADGKDKPVEGLQDTLKAQVIVGGGAKTLDLALSPVFNQPGKYAGRFQPTKSGQYQFRVYGQIEGQPIDERFESGPGRFNDVESLAPRQFPEQVGTNADLQARIDAAEAYVAAAGKDYALDDCKIPLNGDELTMNCDAATEAGRTIRLSFGFTPEGTVAVMCEIGTEGCDGNEVPR